MVEVELEVTVRFCDDEVDVVKLPSPEYTAMTENGEAAVDRAVPVPTQVVAGRSMVQSVTGLPET